MLISDLWASRGLQTYLIDYKETLPLLLSTMTSWLIQPDSIFSELFLYINFWLKAGDVKPPVSICAEKF